VPCPSKCSCNNDLVDCGKAGLTEIPSDIPPNTQHLYLENNFITEIPDGVFSSLARLQVQGTFQLDVWLARVSLIVTGGLLGHEGVFLVWKKRK